MESLYPIPGKNLTLGAIAVLAIFAGSVEADVTKAAWADHTTWIYEIGHMPDLDQRRPSLPGSGNMYCVPTSVMNKMIYIANHGYPGMAPPPGPGNWQLQSRFDNASAALDDMGSLMGTTTADGTFSNGWEKGARTWINARYPGMFVVSRYSRSGSYWPKVSHIGQTALSGGSSVLRSVDIATMVILKPRYLRS